MKYNNSNQDSFLTSTCKHIVFTKHMPNHTYRHIYTGTHMHMRVRAHIQLLHAILKFQPVNNRNHIDNCGNHDDHIIQGLQSNYLRFHAKNI